MNHVAAAFALWLCAAMPVLAQNAENLPTVGVLRINTPDTVEPFATGFRNALAALGLVDGRNIRLEVRLAEGHVERLPELAESLARAKASVIVALGAPAIRAAQRATSTIPIVANAELVDSGLIASLARPGGNTTGVSMLGTELDAKRLEILKEIVPSGRRLAVLDAAVTKVPTQAQAIADAAHALGVELQTVDIRLPTGIVGDASANTVADKEIRIAAFRRWQAAQRFAHMCTAGIGEDQTFGDLCGEGDHPLTQRGEDDRRQRRIRRATRTYDFDSAPRIGSPGAVSSRQCARLFNQKICAVTLPAFATANAGTPASSPCRHLRRRVCRRAEAGVNDRGYWNGRLHKIVYADRISLLKERQWLNL